MDELTKNEWIGRVSLAFKVLMYMGLFVGAMVVAMFAAGSVYAQLSIDERWYSANRANPDGFVDAVAETIALLPTTPVNIRGQFRTTLIGKLRVGTVPVDAIPEDFTKEQTDYVLAIDRHLISMGATNASVLRDYLFTNAEFGEGEGEGEGAP